MRIQPTTTSELDKRVVRGGLTANIEDSEYSSTTSLGSIVSIAN